jgi:transcriptional regulator with XRE-family HTH domain
MADLDLDLLADEIKNKIADEGLSVRKAADEVGCSASTLTRMMDGRNAPNVPDWESLSRVIHWLGRSPSDFEKGKRTPQHRTTLAEVEAHLRALQDIKPRDAEMLVAVVKAAYLKAREARGQRSD